MKSFEKGRRPLTLTFSFTLSVGMLEVEVTEGSEFIRLPCQTTSPLLADTTVEWSRSQPIPMIVHVFPNSSAELPKKQDEFFCGRTRMHEDSLKTGDLSLTLKYPSERDNGHYVCTVNTGTDVLRQKVALRHVKSEWKGTRVRGGEAVHALTFVPLTNRSVSHLGHGFAEHHGHRSGCWRRFCGIFLVLF